jgi:hypothetical protein
LTLRNPEGEKQEKGKSRLLPERGAVHYRGP